MTLERISAVRDVGNLAMQLLVDQFPFPFDRPQGQELLRVLSQIYPRPGAVAQLAAKAGFDLSTLPLDSPARDLLFAMLKDGAVANLVRPLVKTALEENERNIRAEFLQKLLTDSPETIAVDAEQVAPDGTPRFLRGTDEVAESEALLFHDDLMTTVTNIPQLRVVLEKLEHAAAAVCRLTTSCPGATQNGTGFRIGPDLVLTNWHVLKFSEGETIAVEARFGYDDDGSGEPKPTTPLAGRLDSIRGDAADDWAVISFQQPMPEQVPILKLGEAAAPVLGEPAYIIQHPGGRPKRLAYVRNSVFFTDAKVVQYLSDTQQGSSGAPVLNQSCQLLAVHRQGGTPQAKAGKPPLKKNEGVRIDVIRNGMTQRGIAFL